MESASRKKRKSVDSETSDNETASILKTRRTRAPGRYDRRLDRKFRSCIPFPSLRERESRLERRIRFFHNLQRAITKSVYRSEWSRSALLLAALFRKQHQKAITFRGHREPDDIAKRFPFEELLIRTLCHLDDGNSLLIPYIEALKESKELVLSAFKQFHFHTIGLMQLLMENRIEDSNKTLYDLLRIVSFRQPYSQPHFMTLRLLVMFLAWNAEIGSSKSSLEFIPKPLDVSEEAITLAQQIWGLAKKIRAKNKDITTFFIQLQIAIWLDYQDEVQDIIDAAIQSMERHADVHLLRIATQSTKRRSEAIGEASIELMKIHPQQGGFLMFEVLEEDAFEKWTMEKVECLFLHLDVCHPDQKSIDDCLEKWKTLFRLLKHFWRFESKEKSAFNHKVESLLKSRRWWKTYFFSPFAVRSLLLKGGVELSSVHTLLCIWGNVSCYLFPDSYPFLTELKRNLDQNQYNRIEKEKRKLMDLWSTVSEDGDRKAFKREEKLEQSDSDVSEDDEEKTLEGKRLKTT